MTKQKKILFLAPWNGGSRDGKVLNWNHTGSQLRLRTPWELITPGLRPLYCSVPAGRPKKRRPILTRNRYVTYGRFHVKGPRKKVNVKKWIFLWNVKDNRANWWFWPFLNNSCNLGVFLAKNQKYPKITVLKKRKLKKRRKKVKDWKTYFKYHR